MGLFDKVHNQQQKIQTVQSPKDNLDKQEIEFILNTIKESNFKGEDLDILYKLVIKLQNQYVKLGT
jgi:hypothetical protein